MFVWRGDKHDQHTGSLTLAFSLVLAVSPQHLEEALAR